MIQRELEEQPIKNTNIAENIEERAEKGDSHSRMFDKSHMESEQNKINKSFDEQNPPKKIENIKNM